MDRKQIVREALAKGYNRAAGIKFGWRPESLSVIEDADALLAKLDAEGPQSLDPLMDAEWTATARETIDRLTAENEKLAGQLQRTIVERDKGRITIQQLQNGKDRLRAELAAARKPGRVLSRFHVADRIIDSLREFAEALKTMKDHAAGGREDSRGPSVKADGPPAADCCDDGCCPTCRLDVAEARVTELTTQLDTIGVLYRDTCEQLESARAELRIAASTLQKAGWTHVDNARAWKPPLGPSASPLLGKIDELEARVKELESAKPCGPTWKEIYKHLMSIWVVSGDDEPVMQAWLNTQYVSRESVEKPLREEIERWKRQYYDRTQLNVEKAQRITELEARYKKLVDCINGVVVEACGAAESEPADADPFPHWYEWINHGGETITDGWMYAKFFASCATFYRYEGTEYPESNGWTEEDCKRSPNYVRRIPEEPAVVRER